MNTLETVGKVSKPFGREGELIINLYDTFPEEFDKREPLFASIDALAVPLFIEKFERRGRSSALVTFADFDTQERAAELVGLELSLRTDDEEADDDIVYLEDLVGFRATFDGHPLRGEITDYIDSEQNPLFAITAEGREILVPAAEEMISALDIDAREITFVLPEGLLDLYLLIPPPLFSRFSPRSGKIRCPTFSRLARCKSFRIQTSAASYADTSDESLLPCAAACRCDGIRLHTAGDTPPFPP